MKVKAAILIQTNDMSQGIDDGSLSVPVGTEGSVIGTIEDKLVVEFKVGPFKVTYECSKEELIFDDTTCGAVVPQNT